MLCPVTPEIALRVRDGNTTGIEPRLVAYAERLLALARQYGARLVSRHDSPLWFHDWPMDRPQWDRRERFGEQFNAILREATTDAFRREYEAQKAAT
jgi:hypothetical protein